MGRGPDRAGDAGPRGVVSGVRHDGGMVRSGGRSGGGIAVARRPEVRLPPLTEFEGGGLEPDGDYDGVRFGSVDLADESGPGARFMDCALEGCSLDRTELGRARFIDSVLTGVRGVGTDLASASLRDVEVVDARLGGVQLHGAVLERVLVRGGKIDYLNLRKARLKDVVFEGCVLAEPDFGGAQLTRVEFRDCVLKRADFSAVRMEAVDLRAVAELDIARGVERLAGAVISPAQLMELAPAFAAQIGVRVEA
ncbi:pentapeptide repeat-containing protein [Streptomyces sp. A0958]|nr:pentapeptide repeat-containing protein [Streptomyces sp. A0958]